MIDPPASQMTPAMMLETLCAIWPEFRRRFLESTFCYGLDGRSDFSHHGLWIELSHFIRDELVRISDEELHQLFQMIEPILLVNHRPIDDNTPNAIGSCFLENLAGDDRIMSQRLRSFMGPETRFWFDPWDFKEGQLL